MRKTVLMLAFSLFLIHIPAYSQTYNSASTKPIIAKCPVTGMKQKVTSEGSTSKYKGKTYSFCCPACKPKFDANPEKYLKTFEQK